GWKMTGKTTIDGGQIETDSISTAKLQAGELSGMILTSESETGRFSVEGQHAKFVNTDTGNITELTDTGVLVYTATGRLTTQLDNRMVASRFFGTSGRNVYLA